MCFCGMSKITKEPHSKVIKDYEPLGMCEFDGVLTCGGTL